MLAFFSLFHFAVDEALGQMRVTATEFGKPLMLAELIFAEFIFAVFVFCETFNKDVIRENRFRKISRIWKQ